MRQICKTQLPLLQSSALVRAALPRPAFTQSPGRGGAVPTVERNQLRVRPHLAYPLANLLAQQTAQTHAIGVAHERCDLIDTRRDGMYANAVANFLGSRLYQERRQSESH